MIQSQDWIYSVDLAVDYIRNGFNPVVENRYIGWLVKGTTRYRLYRATAVYLNILPKDYL